MLRAWCLLEDQVLQSAEFVTQSRAPVVACKGLQHTEVQGCVWERYRLWAKTAGAPERRNRGSGEQTPNK